MGMGVNRNGRLTLGLESRAAGTVLGSRKQTVDAAGGTGRSQGQKRGSGRRARPFQGLPSGENRYLAPTP